MPHLDTGYLRPITQFYVTICNDQIIQAHLSRGALLTELKGVGDFQPAVSY